MTYTRSIPGPDIDEPFTVLTGYVTVYGEGETVALTAGCTWPGLDHLPDWILDYLQPSEAHQTPGTTLLDHVPTPREIEFGAALVHAQMLRGRRSLDDRMGLLARDLDVVHVNQVTLAGLLASTREMMSKILHPYRRAAAHQNAAD